MKKRKNARKSTKNARISTKNARKSTKNARKSTKNARNQMEKMHGIQIFICPLFHFLSAFTVFFSFAGFNTLLIFGDHERLRR